MNTLKKNSTAIILALILGFSLHAQNNKTGNETEHKIIFQLTSGDTTSHKQLMKQLNNILTISPSTKIEIVCHGAGLDILVSDKTIVEEKIKLLTEKGVAFVVANSP